MMKNCLIPLYAVLILASPIAQALEMDELFEKLRQRQEAFLTGTVEARQSSWRLSAKDSEFAIDLIALATLTPSNAERAKTLAANLEISAIERLGPPRQRAWAFFTQEVGNKLIEIPLEPGDAIDRPVRSNRDGMKVYGYKDGITASYDELYRQLLISPGTADSVFQFRTQTIDPTLRDFPLFAAFKEAAALIAISQKGEGSYRVSLEFGGRRSYFHFDAPAGQFLLSRIDSEPVANTSGPRTLFLAGNYGSLPDSSTPTLVPYTALNVEFVDGGTQLDLFTVTKWSAAPVTAKQLEVRVPRGTNIIRGEPPVLR